MRAGGAALAGRLGHGCGTRSRPGRVAGKGIDELVGHYTQIIGRLDAPPVVIGHSVGGLIAQRLLGQDLAAAGVAIDAAPVNGVI